MAIVESVTKVKCDRCGVTKTRGMVKVEGFVIETAEVEFLSAIGMEDFCPVCAKAIVGAFAKIRQPVKRTRKAKEQTQVQEPAAA
jgi:hypothetical protein